PVGPRPTEHAPRLPEPRGRAGPRNPVDGGLAGDAAGESRNDAPVRHAVEHRQLFGQAERVVERQQIAVDEELEPPSPLGGGGRQEIRRVHEAYGEVWCSLNPTPS